MGKPASDRRGCLCLCGVAKIANHKLCPLARSWRVPPKKPYRSNNTVFAPRRDQPPVAAAMPAAPPADYQHIAMDFGVGHEREIETDILCAHGQKQRSKDLRKTKRGTTPKKNLCLSRIFGRSLERFDFQTSRHGGRRSGFWKMFEPPHVGSYAGEGGVSCEQRVAHITLDAFNFRTLQTIIHRGEQNGEPVAEAQEHDHQARRTPCGHQMSHYLQDVLPAPQDRSCPPHVSPESEKLNVAIFPRVGLPEMVNVIIRAAVA